MYIHGIKDDRTEKKHQLAFIARVGLCVLSLIVAAVLAPRAWAQDDSMEATAGGLRLVIHKDACQLGGWFKEWKKAEWYVNGQEVAACWRLIQRPDGSLSVSTVDAAGDPGSMPLSMFKPVTGA